MGQPVNKILFVNSSWAPVQGGISDYIQMLAASLGRLGRDVRVVTSSEFGIKPHQSTYLKVDPIISRWHRSRFLRVLPVLWSFHPDWIVLQYPSEIPGRDSSLTPWVPVLSRWLYHQARVAYIVHEYADTLEINKPALRRAFRNSTVVFCFNESDRRALELDGVNAIMSTIGSNILPVHHTSHKTDIKLNGFVYFGRQDERKGFGDLLLALKRMPKLKLKAIGPIDARYHAEAARVGVAEQIEWCGVLENAAVSNALQSAIATIAPFRGGVRPNSSSVLAALANGCRVITTLGDDTPDYLVNNNAVKLIKSGEVDQLILAVDGISSQITSAETASLSATQSYLNWDTIGLDMLKTFEDYGKVS